MIFFEEMNFTIVRVSSFYFWLVDCLICNVFKLIRLVWCRYLWNRIDSFSKIHHNHQSRLDYCYYKMSYLHNELCVSRHQMYHKYIRNVAYKRGCYLWLENKYLCHEQSPAKRNTFIIPLPWTASILIEVTLLIEELFKVLISKELKCMPQRYC